MKRRYSAEITFSGLLLIDIHEPSNVDNRERGPRTAKEVRVLLADTSDVQCHQHKPRLTYFAEDDLSLSPGIPTGVDPSGRETISLDLYQTDIDVIAPFPHPGRRDGKPHELSWFEGKVARRDSLSAVPQSPYEERFLDWTIQASDIGIPQGSVRGRRSTSIIRLPPGSWQSTGVARNREVASLAPHVWNVTNGAGHITRTQALSRAISIRFEGLRYGLSIRLTPRDTPENQEKQRKPQEVVLVPGPSNKLNVAISNLPPASTPPAESHLSMFTSLLDKEVDLRGAKTAIVDQVSCQGGTSVCDHTLYIRERSS